MTNMEILFRNIFYLCNGFIFDEDGFAVSKKGWQIRDAGEIFVNGWYIYKFDILELSTGKWYAVEQWFTKDDTEAGLKYEFYGARKNNDYYKVMNGVV